MEKSRRRQRVQITIDPGVWKRCQDASDIVGADLSWSQVAEFAFLTLLEQIDAMRDQVFTKLRKDASPEEVAQAFRDYYHRKIHHLTSEVYAQIEADIEQGSAQKSKVPRGRKPG